MLPTNLGHSFIPTGVLEGRIDYLLLIWSNFGLCQMGSDFEHLQQPRALAGLKDSKRL
jgi:hypothetical protein